SVFFGLHVLNSFYGDITAGPDGALWFLVNNTIGPVQLGRITTDGEQSFIDVTAPFGLGGITTGPDGNIWFTETGGNAPMYRRRDHSHRHRHGDRQIQTLPR